MFNFFFFLFGAIVGSFLNALIYRLPRDINIALPRSSCPNCKKLIYWYENIPILSYLLLKGKCSKCKEKISIQYPLVEVLSGIVSLLLVPSSFDLFALFDFLFLFSIAACFIVHIIVDLKHQILPDGINIYLALLFLAKGLIINSWFNILLGTLIGFGFPYLISYIFYKLKGQIGLGGGDIKLWGALGIYLGPTGIIHNIFLSCFMGSLIGGGLLILKLIKRETPIPFGPFIIITAIFQIYFSSWLNSLLKYIS